MELVYLWVKEYKNIKNQGFNFSPRFDCKYDEDSKELTIDKNDDYVSIFPENINITAIVGENGSGKSSICNLLIGSANRKGVINIYKIQDKFYYHHDQYVEVIKYPDTFMNFDIKLIDQIKVNYDFFSQEFRRDTHSNMYAEFNYSVKDVHNSIFAGDYSKINIDEYLQLLKDIESKYDATMLKKLFTFYPKKNIKYQSLSHGERQIYSLLLLIYDKIITSDKKDISIILDEIEISLHPQWQKMIISELIILCSHFTDKKFHIIISSHSPFILSDLPKENVIFLEKGEPKYPFKDKQTFGANIHTLLSDGFFMNDGLMGEFAKGKIEEIKKFYELIIKCEKIMKKSEKIKSKIKGIYKEYEVNFRHIQSIIGEPFLQTVIKNYLDELDIFFNGKNKFLDNEIKRLQDLKD
jgi:predicted ATP-binding protein involved in virulence